MKPFKLFRKLFLYLFLSGVIYSSVNCGLKNPCDAVDPNCSPLSLFSLLRGTGTAATASTPTGLAAIPGDSQIVLAWNLVSGAESYNIYYNLTGSPTTSDTKISATKSPYVHTGLTNGQIYYYIITSVIAGTESGPSAAVSATANPSIAIAPAMPTGVAASPGNAQNTVSWPAVSGATSYNLYHSTVSGTGTGGTLVAGATSPYTHTGLVNGTPYYYVIVAVNGVGSSPASAEVTATPQLPPPAAPNGVGAAAGDSTVAVSWTASGTATSYNIYRNNNGGALALIGSIAASPYNDATAVNGTTYNYVIVAVNAGGSSPYSAPASATPQVTPPGAPTGVGAAPGNAQNTITWTAVGGATSYNIYWNTTGAPTTASSKITGAASGYVHSLLANGTIYYYVVTAVISGVEGLISAPASAMPQIPAPAAPTAPVASGLTSQNIVYWTPSATATSYKIYWSTVSGTGTGGTVITPANSPYFHTGLTNGTAYYYVITAVNAGGESTATAQVTATPVPSPPTAPTALTASPGDSKVNLAWTASTGAAIYYIYGNANGSAAAIIGSVIPPTVTYTDNTAVNGTTYNYIVVAGNAGGTASSNIASATPQVVPAGAPTAVVASPRYGKIILSWTNGTGAVSHNIYWSNAPGVTLASNKISNVTSPYTHQPLVNGAAYYYKIAAVNAAGVETLIATDVTTTPAYAPADSYLWTGAVSAFSSISVTGTNITFGFPLSLDDDFQIAAIPFTFYYLGAPQNFITISTNGYACFDAIPGLCNSRFNTDFITTTAPMQVLAPWWDDLDLTVSGWVYTGTSGVAPNRVYTIEWAGIETFATAIDVYSFQIKLYETSNVIEFHYGPATLGGNVTSASVGIKGATGGECDYYDGMNGGTGAVALCANGVAGQSTYGFANFPTGSKIRFTPTP